MVPVSIVIITKNEAETIASCVKASKTISDDIIVIDNDSTDGTPKIAFEYGCRVYHEHWDGYGANKNKGIKYAKYDWILSIDADEIPDEGLVRALHETQLDDPAVVYDIKFISYFGRKPVRFGTWGRDHHIRLFNRKLVKWSEPPVHEILVLPPGGKVKKLKGRLHHYSVNDDNDSYSKTLHYAKLSAEKYFKCGKRATPVKLYLAPLFHFIKSYLLLLGFLDGRKGWNIARMIATHTKLKYRFLQKLGMRTCANVPKVKESLVVEY
jgi:glycosyltransferase involved in cell wall biosynthesis